jgi:hypothetical protein
MVIKQGKGKLVINGKEIEVSEITIIIDEDDEQGRLADIEYEEIECEKYQFIAAEYDPRFFI